MTVRVLIALGSNIAPTQCLPQAVALLRNYGQIEALSPVYQSAPVGGSDQPVFLNAAALLRTDLAPAALRRALRAIEAQLGRQRTADKFAPRSIDLDIILYGDEIVVTAETRIPHPDLLIHRHIARPAADLAPAWPHPELGLTLQEIAARLGDCGLTLRPDVALDII